MLDVTVLFKWVSLNSVIMAREKFKGKSKTVLYLYSDTLHSIKGISQLVDIK